MAVVGLFRIPDKGTLRHALTSLYGVGRKKANAFCDALGLPHNQLVSETSPATLSSLYHMIDRRKDVEGPLRKQLEERAKLLYDLGTYRGVRRVQGYPVRGQRTKTNAQTAKKMPVPGVSTSERYRG